MLENVSSFMNFFETRENDVSSISSRQNNIFDHPIDVNQISDAGCVVKILGTYIFYLVSFRVKTTVELRVLSVFIFSFKIRPVLDE